MSNPTHPQRNLRQQRNDAIKARDAALADLAVVREAIVIRIARTPQPVQCPNGHGNATYVAAIEAVRCPVCGLVDVSADDKVSA